jgi:hypothetical protein
VEVALRLAEPRFALRLSPGAIEDWATRYQVPPAEQHLIEVVGPAIRQRGYCEKAELMLLGDWKSPRSRPRREENSEEFVREVTRTALATSNEQLRIEVLTLLRGVSRPTASVLLHISITDTETYPIVDVRAIWAFGIDKPPPVYDFPFWQSYVRACREVAKQIGLPSLRTLDRALWQYAKENQPSG